MAPNTDAEEVSTKLPMEAELINGNSAAGVQGLESYLDVQTTQGPVRGFLNGDKTHYSFTGLHYATVPTGKDRFKGPLAGPTWTKPLDANKTVICAQFSTSGKYTGVEDCLVINVFVPAGISLTSKTPVLAVLHGGSGVWGSGEIITHSRLLKQGVVVASINYRLGMLGFLCLRTQEAPGNAGLKDQIAALKWIQTNIARFGGNALDVTLYGVSAGSSSAELLLLSSRANGLFHKLILESGSAIAGWAVGYDPIGGAQKVAAALGHGTVADISKLTNILVATSAEDLAKTTATLSLRSIPLFDDMPCVESKNVDPAAVITANPRDILKAGKYNKVPTLIAFMNLEAYYYEYFWKNLGWNSSYIASPVSVLYSDLVFANDSLKSSVSKRMASFYNGLESAVFDAFVDFMSDYIFFYSILESAKLHTANGVPVYLMKFAYHDSATAKGAVHGDLYRYVCELSVKGTKGDLTADRVAEIIGNFVKSAKPVPSTSKLLPISWPPVTKEVVNYMVLADELSTATNPLPERFKFWSDIYACCYNPLRVP